VRFVMKKELFTCIAPVSDPAGSDAVASSRH